MFLELMEVIFEDERPYDGPEILRYSTYQEGCGFIGRLPAHQERTFGERLKRASVRLELLHHRVKSIRFERINLDAPEYDGWNPYNSGQMLIEHEFLEEYDAMSDCWNMRSVELACQC